MPYLASPTWMEDYPHDVVLVGNHRVGCGRAVGAIVGRVGNGATVTGTRPPGGGGAGGMRTGVDYAVSEGTYAVTVGTGGVGGTVTSAGGSYDFRMDGTNGRNGGENPGGGSFWGVGQVGTSGLGNATLGVGYGSGGQGPTQSTSSYSSVVGQVGLVVIWEYK